MQLTYEEAFDPYHSIFRLFRMKNFIESGAKLSKDKIRVIDFYLLFPFRIQEIRLKPENIEFRKISKMYLDKKPYGKQPSNLNLFTRMKAIQLAAINTFCNEGYAELMTNDGSIIAFTKKVTPSSIATVCQNKNTSEKELIEILSVLVNQYDFLGNDGLKARTGLMEYRYDAA